VLRCHADMLLKKHRVYIGLADIMAAWTGLRGQKYKLEKPSLEVAPPTLRLVLLIYSFQFRSAFP